MSYHPTMLDMPICSVEPVEPERRRWQRYLPGQSTVKTLGKRDPVASVRCVRRSERGIP